MIRSLTIKNGLLEKLLGHQNINFDEGINVIWGKNGTGKSSLLKALAHYSCVGKHSHISGFSKESHAELQLNLDGIEREDSTLAEILDNKAPTGICKIEWDGTPSVYVSIEDRAGRNNMKQQLEIDQMRIADAPYYEQKEILQPLLNSREVHGALFSGLSSGELIILLLNTLKDVKLPDLSKMVYTNTANDFHRKWASVFAAYVSQKSRDGKPTIILDEPDRNLDYDNQHLLHTKILPRLAKKHQVIVVSHSPFAFMQSRNIIDLDGTANTAKSLYSKLHEIWRNEHSEEE